MAKSYFGLEHRICCLVLAEYSSPIRSTVQLLQLTVCQALHWQSQEIISTSYNQLHPGMTNMAKINLSHLKFISGCCTFTVKQNMPLFCIWIYSHKLIFVEWIVQNGLIVDRVRLKWVGHINVRISHCFCAWVAILAWWIKDLWLLTFLCPMTPLLPAVPMLTTCVVLTSVFETSLQNKTMNREAAWMFCDPLSPPLLSLIFSDLQVNLWTTEHTKTGKAITQDVTLS